MGSYAATVLAKDVEAFMRLYHPAVRVFDAWGIWLYDGAPALANRRRRLVLVAGKRPRPSELF